MDFTPLEQAAHEAADRWTRELCGDHQPADVVKNLARAAFLLYAIDGYGHRPVYTWRWPFEQLLAAEENPRRPWGDQPWAVLLRAAWQDPYRTH